MLNNKETGY